MSKDEIEETFGNKIRGRAMGLLISNDKLLMIKHRNLNSSNEYWLPPGGGIEFGESAIDAVVREFKEETNLVVQVKDFITAGEFLSKPLHAIELFFLVCLEKGVLKTGFDPELLDNQIIDRVEFLSLSEIKMKGSDNHHPLFVKLNSFDDLLSPQGLFLFDNNR